MACQHCASFALTIWLLAPSPASARRSTGLPRLATVSDWYQRASLLSDRRALLQVLGNGTVPDGSFLLATRIVRGVGQPGYELYSLGNSAFAYSWKKYWPASTVKLVATVGALRTLKTYGLNGNAVVEMRDADGSYRGPVFRLYQRALIKSTNVDYNRLVEIAGFDALNRHHFNARWGTPRMVLQRRYTHPTPTANLRDSPPIRFQKGSKRGVIPARHGTLTHPRCPEEANCVTLFELQEVLRRLMLHDEIPEEQRFPLAKIDRRRIRAALLKSHKKIDGAAASALGKDVRVYNKAGRVPGDDHLDNALIVDEHGNRYLLALSVPYSSAREPDAVSAKKLSRLAQRALAFLANSTKSGLWLQADAGVPIRASMKPHTTNESTTGVGVALSAPQGKADRFKVYWNRTHLASRAFTRDAVRIVLPSGTGVHALTCIAYRGVHAVGYKLYQVTLTKKTLR